LEDDTSRSAFSVGSLQAVAATSASVVVVEATVVVVAAEVD